MSRLQALLLALGLVLVGIAAASAQGTVQTTEPVRIETR
jgi:hypothetical protein